MAGEIDLTLRSADSYALGRRAMEMMQKAGVWPTPLNYEIWLYCAGDPDGELAQEVGRLISAGASITEDVSERLAAAYLPRQKVQEQIREAGDQLTRELDAVAKAVATAQRSSAAYGRTLGAATRDLEGEADAAALQRVVESLSEATRRVHQHNQTLERRLASSSEEMTRLRGHLEEVRRDAMTDALTALANRKAFDEALASACEQADATGNVVGLALLDIDHFKAFNDTWGHQTGDQVLRYVASVLGRGVQPPAIAARYGGEEFALVVPGATASTLAAMLEELRVEICGRSLKRRATGEDLGAVSVSAGWAIRRPREAATTLTERADKALYASKRGGRNRVTGAEQAAAKRAA